MPRIRIAGLDGSKTNFGIATLVLDTDQMHLPTGGLTVESLLLIKTEKSKIKNVRASSDNLIRSQTIARALREELTKCASAFIEVPSGGKSYDAVLGFGIVIGIYASLTIPTIEVSPSETKIAAVGTRTASKEEMIEWALELFPDAPWRMHKVKGVMVPNRDNEHLADAVAIALAGIKTPAFKQAIAMLMAPAA
jgi:Holliday junction resolvasome RuvABC endonuclease subunit